MRPFITCHMATTIDGRLHPSQFTPAASGISTEALGRHYEEVADRLSTEGSIVGGRAMSELAQGSGRLIANAPTMPREPHVANRNGWTSPSLSILPGASIMAKTVSVAITSWRCLASRSPTPITRTARRWHLVYRRGNEGVR
jgi:hypothetical protein